MEKIMMRRRIRWLGLVVVLGCLGPAARADDRADDRAHEEMAAALTSQADLYPPPLVMPTVASNSHRTGSGASKATVTGHTAAVVDAAHSEAGEVSQHAQAQGAAQAAARQAAAATAAAANQSQSQAAKSRATTHAHSH
jgi:hypothetical protein